MGNTILIVDDDKEFLKLLRISFTQAGFKVYTAGTSKEALHLAFRHLPDCFLLDYYIGCDAAFPACQGIRSHELLKNSPIVVLSDDPSRATNSYDVCQADVFLDKDRSCPEMIAVVKRQLRRTDAVFWYVSGSDLMLDGNNMCILREGKPPLCLSPEQFRFFSILFKNSPKFVSEEEMCRRVFMADFTKTMRKALDMVAYRLRVKMGAQLARRIKSSKAYGWIYLQPRSRHKCVLPAENTSFRS